MVLFAFDFKFKILALCFGFGIFATERLYPRSGGSYEDRIALHDEQEEVEAV